MSNIEDDLRCIICFDIFKEPVSLNCGHSFCWICIQETIQRTHKCPVCSFPLFMQQNFQTNITLKKIIQNLKNEGKLNEEEEKIIEQKEKVVKEEKENKSESKMENFLLFKLKKKKAFFFDNTLYQFELEESVSWNLFNHFVAERIFACLIDQSKFASVFKLDQILYYQKNKIKVIARCIKKVQIDHIQEISFKNNKFLLTNNLITPDTQIILKFLHAQSIQKIPNSESQKHKNDLQNINMKLCYFLSKLRKNNYKQYEILTIRHQVNLISDNLSLNYNNNLHQYIEYISQLLNLSITNKQQLYNTINIDEKLKIMKEYFSKIKPDNDPIFVFYIHENLESHNNLFYILLTVVLILTIIKITEYIN